MSESGARGVVVAHGDLAAGLVDAVRQIADSPPDVLVPVSNRGLSPDAIAERVRAAVGAEAPVIVFTDLVGGSCGATAQRLRRELPGLVVVSGVNLPLLLDFVTHRDVPMSELVPRLVARGRAGVCCHPTEFDDAGGAVPDR